MQNARRKPHKMRTVAEWRAIYLRVRDWDGGEGNVFFRQCPVCLGRFKAKRTDSRFCSKACQNTWRTARMIAGDAAQPSNRQTVKPSNRYVELAVCEDCHRVFRPASMRGALCVSCASRRAVPDPSAPPAGFVQAVCPDCGKAFTRPVRGKRAARCWKCADRRAKKAQWHRRRKQLGLVTPEWAAAIREVADGVSWGHVGEAIEALARRFGVSVPVARERWYAHHYAKSRGQTVKPSNRQTGNREP